MLKGCMCAQSLSHVWLFVTPLTVAHQAPLSMEFSRQEYWSRLSFPSPEDLPHPGIEPTSAALQADSLSVTTWETRVCWLLVAQTCVLLTHSLSQKSLSTLTVPCRMPFPGEQDENKMLPDLKKPQGSVRYRWKLQSMPQMIPLILILVKHVT